MKILGSLVCFVSLVMGSSQAAAQEEPLAQAAEFAKDIPWKKLGVNALQRARRAIALGPFAGAMGVVSLDGDAEAALSFGLSLSTFKIPIVPDRKTVERILMERFKARFQDKLKAALLGGTPPAKEDLQTLAREIWQEILEEFIEEGRQRKWEYPGFHAHLEGARLVDLEDWNARATFAIGLGRASYGLTLAGQFGDANSFLLGPEVSVQLLLGKRRTPIVDLFGRVDFPVVNGDSALVSLGARFVLDII